MNTTVDLRLQQLETVCPVPDSLQVFVKGDLSSVPPGPPHGVFLLLGKLKEGFST